MKKWFIGLLQLAIAVVVLWIIFKDTQWQDVAPILESISPQAILMAFVFILIQFFLAVFRWYYVADKLSLPLTYSVATNILWVSTFINQALPSGLGSDMVRMVMMHRKKMQTLPTLNSIFIDRILTLMGCFILVLILQVPLIQMTENHLMATTFAAVSIGGVVSIFVGIHLGIKIGKEDHRFRLLRGIAKVSKMLHIYFRSIPNILVPMVCTMFGFLCQTTAAYMLASGMGLEIVNPWLFFVFCVPALVLASFPISVAGWGVREGAMIFALGHIGIGSPQALAISIALGFALIVCALPGSIYLLSHMLKTR